ncbi:hypothetical protein BH23ACT9_BH23ACT9_18230 [soil metagenome]
MGQNEQAKDLAAAGLGLLALALGAATILGVVRPSGDGPSNLLLMGLVGFVAGMAGLYLAQARGYGRQLAVFGTAIALIGLAVYGGALAIDALISDVR